MINITKVYLDRIINSFNNDINHPRILLISTGAGAVGLSLHQGSSTIFISEPCYNPFIEKQAEERVHRMGQTDHVRIFKYEMEHGVETWINGLKDYKMNIANKLGLVKTNRKTQNLSFKQVMDLFVSYVGFDKN